VGLFQQPRVQNRSNTHPQVKKTPSPVLSRWQYVSLHGTEKENRTLCFAERWVARASLNVGKRKDNVYLSKDITSRLPIVPVSDGGILYSRRPQKNKLMKQYYVFSVPSLINYK
jgi:hypothetical protein